MKRTKKSSCEIVSQILATLRIVGALTGGASTAALAEGINSTTSGSDLTAGQTLTPPDERFSAKMQTDGNFVVYSGSQSTWSSGTNANAGTRLSVQSDGNLVLYSAANSPEWQSGTSGTATSTVLTVQNDGNLVLYSTGGISSGRPSTAQPDTVRRGPV